jgi:SAM-dependent methyltransferase
MLSQISQHVKRNVAYVALKEARKALIRRIKLPQYLGDRHECPVCGTGLAAFKPLWKSYRRHTAEAGYIYPLSQVETFNIDAYSCPACDASDRERLYALYIEDAFRRDPPRRGLRMVEFAPSPALQKKLRSYPFIDYRSADLFRNNVDDRQVDITDMHQYADGAFDIFLCSHVLEHIPDDRRAMRQLHRILSPEGFGIVMVPLVHGVEETHEDPAIVTDQQRWKYYGSGDHLRQYGRRDFLDRLNAAGFAVQRLSIDDFGADRFQRAGIAEDSILYVVRKQ